MFFEQLQLLKQPEAKFLKLELELGEKLNLKHFLNNLKHTI